MKQTATIRVSLQSAAQMVSQSAFQRHRLHDDAEDFLLEEAWKLPLNSDIHITITLQEAHTGDSEELVSAIHDHFKYLRMKANRKIEQTLKIGWLNLLIGFGMLGLLVLLVIFIGKQFPEGGFSATISELFIILGWVIIWRPVETLLYDWRPLKRESNLYGRLERSTIEVVGNL